MHTAVLFCVVGDGDDTFTISREVEDDVVQDRQRLFTYLTDEAKVMSDEVDTILVMRNGGGDTDFGENPGPKVVQHLTAGNGDFEGLY